MCFYKTLSKHTRVITAFSFITGVRKQHISFVELPEVLKIHIFVACQVEGH